jgi:hypothetical protein
MPIKKYMARVLIALVAFSGLLGLAHAQNLVWKGKIGWQNVLSYDVVRVHFQPTNNAWWDSK